MCTKHNALRLTHTHTHIHTLTHCHTAHQYTVLPISSFSFVLSSGACPALGLPNALAQDQDMCAESTTILHAFDLCFASSLTLATFAMPHRPCHWSNSPVAKGPPFHRPTSKQIIAYISAVVYSRTFLFLLLLCPLWGVHFTSHRISVSISSRKFFVFATFFHKFHRKGETLSCLANMQLSQQSCQNLCHSGELSSHPAIDLLKYRSLFHPKKLRVFCSIKMLKQT